MGVARTSEPVTLYPRFNKTSAIPLIPMPPIPTKWTCLMRLNKFPSRLSACAILYCLFHQIHNPPLRIENGNAVCVRLHFFEPFRMAYELQHSVGKTPAVQIGIADHNSRFLVRHGKRILHLVIVGRKWKRNQNSCAASSLDFSHSGSARPRDDEIRHGVLFVKIIEEGANVRFESAFRICTPNFVQLALSSLMYKAQCGFKIGQKLKGFNHSPIDGLRALTPAKNQDRKRRFVCLGCY